MPIRLQLKALRAIVPGGLRHPPRPHGRLGITRRSLLACISFAVTGNILRLPNWIAVAQAEERVWRHGLSPFGDLKYPAVFKHFDYINPNAPKGGVACKARLVHSII
jgi:hypothetical protein